MFDLESRVGVVARPPLLVHLPTFDEQVVRATPLLELLEVGHCYQKPLADIVAEAAAEKVSGGDRAPLLGGRGGDSVGSRCVRTR